MLRKLKERRWIAKSEKYLQAYPDHEPIVTAMLTARVGLKLDYGPRECAEMLMSRELTDAEWAQFKDKWQSAFLYIFG